MTYTRYKIRGKLLEIIDSIPTSITPKDVSTLTAAVFELRKLHHGLSDNPFEYVSDATREEHRDLASIFARLMDMVHNMMLAATSDFRSGGVVFNVDPGIVEVKNQLSGRAEGSSTTAMLLSQICKDREIDDSSEDQSASHRIGQEEKEGSATIGGQDAQYSR